MRCDKNVIKGVFKNYISIHAPRMRCDQFVVTIGNASIHFNPRTSHEVRPILLSFNSVAIISIHAPRMRCDSRSDVEIYVNDAFQSTHLAWGATCLRSSKIVHHGNFNPRTSHEVRRALISGFRFLTAISIHAPRMRCDSGHRGTAGT